MQRGNTGQRTDPYQSFNFMIEIKGIIVGGFTEISGLNSTIGVETIKEGGVNNYELKLPKQVTYSDIVLKRGLGDIDPLWQWYQDVLTGKVVRRNGTLYLLGTSNNHLACWHFSQAWPTQWQGPNFSASSDIVAIESITLAHQGIIRATI